jgi:hypothetical protein
MPGSSGGPTLAIYRRSSLPLDFAFKSFRLGEPRGPTPGSIY